MSDRWSAFGFAAALIAPSATLTYRYLGAAGTIAYVVLGALLLPMVRRRFVTAIVPALSRRAAGVLAAVSVAVLAGAFSFGYPLANSGVIGPGSDRDEHVETGARALLTGDYPYSLIGPPPYDSIISQMPGALVLAIPFVLLGNGAYQNVFWLVAFAALVGHLFRDARAGILLTLGILVASPAVLREFVTGGDLLANSVYVLIASVGVVEAVPRPEVRVGWKYAAAAALGLALSSRAHFLLVLPLVFAALRARGGAGSAFRWVTVTCLSCAAITMPFVIYDPAGFTPFQTVGFLQHESLPPAFGMAVAGACGAVAVCLAKARDHARLPEFLQSCTLVLMGAVAAALAVRALEGRLLGGDVGLTEYGVSFAFFGALGFLPAPPRA